MDTKSPEDTILDMTEEGLAKHRESTAKSAVDVLRAKGSALKAADVLVVLAPAGDSPANT